MSRPCANTRRHTAHDEMGKQVGTFGSFCRKCAQDRGAISQLRLGQCQVSKGDVVADGGRTVIVADYQTVENVLTKKHSSFDRAKQTVSLFSGYSRLANSLYPHMTCGSIIGGSSEDHRAGLTTETSV